MVRAFSGELGEKRQVDNLTSFDLSGLEFKLRPEQEGLHEGSGLSESVAGDVELEYNGKVINLISLKREAFLDGELINEGYEFRLYNDGEQVLEGGLIIDFSPDDGDLPVAEPVIKKSEEASQKKEFNKLGILFTEKLLIFLEDLAKKKGKKLLSKAEHGPLVSNSKLSFEDWKKIFVPLLEKMGYIKNEEENVWLKKLG